MKWICLVIGAMLTIGCAPELRMGDEAPSTGAHLWSKVFGDNGPQLATSVAVDAVGNVFTTGYISGTVDFGNGPLTTAGIYDIFVDKVDAAGNPLWSKRFGDASDTSFQPQMGDSIAVDSAGNVVVAGAFSGTVDFGNGPLMSAGAGHQVLFAAQFDANGNPLWSKRLGDAGSSFYFGGVVAVAIDGDGNIVVTGEFGGTVDFGNGPLTSAGGADVFVAKFAPTGTPLWSKRFGDASDQQAHSIAIDTNGNMVITGEFGGTVVFGNDSLVSAGYNDIFVVKLDPGGMPLWSKRFGGALYDVGWSVALDASQNVLVTGDFYDTVDFGNGPLMSAGADDIFVVKLDATGKSLWSKRFGDASGQSARAIVADGARNVLLTGSYRGAVDFGSGLLTTAGATDDEGFIAKLDRTGAPLWSKRFGDAAYQVGRGVAVDSTGNVLLTGVAEGTIDLGGGPLTSAGNTDIFLAKLAP